MLNEVLRIAHSQGWLDESASYEKTVYLSQGASLWMIISRRGIPDVFIKFSRLVSLATEADRCAEASRSFPDHAPQFLGYFEASGLHVLASRAVPFRAVTVAMTQSATDAAAVRTGLLHFFSRMRVQAHADRLVVHDTWLSALESYFSHHALAGIAQRVLGSLREQLAELPAMLQHGDLVMNNLGLKPGRQLIVFDWEDFGTVALPGLDLFTLEYSFDYEASLVRAQGQQKTSAKVLDIEGCCKALGLTHDTYLGWRLAHAMAFLYIKRSYGPEIQGRLDRYIRELAK